VAVRRNYNTVTTHAGEWTWDATKDRENRLKHGLSLADGVPALADPFSATRVDPHTQEERWQTIGGVGPSAVLLVVHTDLVKQPDGSAIGRIISVRKATRREREAFEDGTF
jgi:uncharacterized DUF497 family protein